MAERTVVKKGKNFVEYSDGTLRIDNVRFSHPHIDKPYAGKTDDGKPATPKYSVVGLLNKKTHVEAKDACVRMIDRLLKENKLERLASDKKFIRNGDDGDKPEAFGHWTVSAREERRPGVRDADNSKMRDDAEIREKFYGGAFGTILIRPWYQSNTYGKRVNAGLSAIQFVKHGEAFGEGRISDDEIDDTFESHESDDDDANGGFDDDGLGGDDEFGGL